MTKAVLTHKPGSIYDDLPEERYHFPATYLRQVEAAVGDFIVYYEPGRTEHSDRQRTGLRSYVATARLTAVRLDPMKSEHYYAIIDPSTYLTFDRPVPFREGTFYYEEALARTMERLIWGRLVGRFVRFLMTSSKPFSELDLPVNSLRQNLSRLGGVCGA